MNSKAQVICTWCGVVFAGLVGIGWWLVAGFIPPHLPGASAADIAAIYQENTLQIRFGIALALSGSALSLPFMAVISVQMRRIEGRNSVLAFTQLGCAAIGVLIFIIPMMTWVSIAFRPDRPPEIIQAMNDFAWHLLLMTLSPAFVQNLCIGFAILLDKRPQPIFPRWSGYLNIWVSILFIPAGILTFFKTGPFAWDGLIAFWLPAVVFFIWIYVMVFLLLRAVRRQEKEGSASIEDPGERYQGAGERAAVGT